MALAIFLSILIFAWYGMKEASKSKPNWNKALVSAMMWPLTLFYKNR
jgi:Na+-transporting methylmalonyl-CoA/oxaloacetate decarboxylase gamma subunit